MSRQGTLDSAQWGVRQRLGSWLRLFYATSRQYFADRVWACAIIVSAVLVIFLAALFTLVTVSVPATTSGEAAPDVLVTALTGWSTFLAGCAVAASLVSGAEWSSGRYAVTFSLTPRRWRVVVAHSLSAGTCAAVAAVPVAFLLLVVVHVVAAANGASLVGTMVDRTPIASLMGVVVLSAVGAGCAASVGSALGMLSRSRVAGPLIVAILFFILPPVAAAAGMQPEFLPAAGWAGLGSVPLLGGTDSPGSGLPMELMALFWPIVATVTAGFRIAETDLA